MSSRRGRFLLIHNAQRLVTGGSKGISPVVWVLTVVTMISLCQGEQRPVDLWLTPVMWIWLFDIALAAVIGSTRFDLGFYAGRLFGLLAASFLLRNFALPQRSL
jgi:hypothetical protein